jgi:hypothetical protein
MIDAGAFTSYLITFLGANTTDVLIGDGVTPKGGGPLKGQPGVEGFAPYIVLMPTRIVQDGQDILGASLAWRLTYSYEVFGGSRKQCDAILTDCREALDELLVLKFQVPGTGTQHWGGNSLNWREWGSPARDDSTQPYSFRAVDSFTLFAAITGESV